MGTEEFNEEGDQGVGDLFKDLFNFGDNGMTSPTASPRAGDMHSRPLSPSANLKDGHMTIKVSSAIEN